MPNVDSIKSITSKLTNRLDLFVKHHVCLASGHMVVINVKKWITLNKRDFFLLLVVGDFSDISRINGIFSKLYF